MRLMCDDSQEEKCRQLALHVYLYSGYLNTDVSQVKAYTYTNLAHNIPFWMRYTIKLKLDVVVEHFERENTNSFSGTYLER